MTIKDISDKLSSLKVYEQRELTDTYNELVFCNAEKDAWYAIIAEVLGPAVKPAGTKPAKDDLKLTDEYGGIFANQTLFKKAVDGVTVVAMFWPWQDDEHTTLKIALVK